jgi:Holliday junction DNA helicase RuvA
VIGSLRGVLLDRSAEGEVLIEVGGVGYEITVNASTLAQLGGLGDDVFVWVHHHVREEIETLYGFATRDERRCFGALLGAHGVGPTLAVAILSVFSPPALVQALADHDVAALCVVPGVGRKTAARLLVELESRLDLPDLDGAAACAASAGGSAANPVADVREALAELGYGPDEVRQATAELASEGEPSALLRHALQQLARTG